MSFFFKSLLLQIFSHNIIAILIRTIVTILVVVFLLPLVFVSLNEKSTKIGLIILIIIINEIIALRVSANVNNQNIKGKFYTHAHTKSALGVNDSKSLYAPTLNNKNLSLLLYTKDIAITNLVPKTIYSEIAMHDDNAKLFAHFSKPIFAIEITTCEIILNNLDQYPLIKKFLKVIKNSKSNEISIALESKILFDSQAKHDSLSGILKCVHALTYCVKKKFNINLLIDNMYELSGFKILLKNLNKDKLKILSVVFETNISNKENSLDDFEKYFAKFVSSIEKECITLNLDSYKDTEDLHIFLQQLHFSKEKMKTLIFNVINICKVNPINKLNKIIVSIYLVNSKEKPDTIMSLASKELLLCQK